MRLKEVGHQRNLTLNPIMLMMENWLTVKKGSLWPPQYTYILLILALHYDARISLTKLTVMFGRLSLQTPVTDPLKAPF